MAGDYQTPPGHERPKTRIMALHPSTQKTQSRQIKLLAQVRPADGSENGTISSESVKLGLRCVPVNVGETERASEKRAASLEEMKSKCLP